MKRTLALLGTVTTLLCSSCGPDTYSINGQLDPAVADSVFLLTYPAREPIARTAAQEDGTFHLTAQLHQPEVAVLISGGRDLTLLFPEPGEITICPDGRGRYRPSGTPANDRYTLLNDSLRALRTEYYALGPDADTTELGALHRTYDRLYDEAIRTNTDNMLGAYLLCEQAETTERADDLQSLLTLFPAQLQETDQLRRVRARIETALRTAIGAPCPAIILPDASGNDVELSTLVGSGKWVLVEFWATWSAASRRELEQLDAWNRTDANDRIEIYGISLDNDTAAWRRYINRMPQTWVQVHAVTEGECRLAEELGIRNLPANLLIDPKGRIVARDLHNKSLIDSISSL